MLRTPAFFRVLKRSGACLAVIWWFCGMQVMAQVNVSVQILPPYPHRISDYASRPNQVVVAVSSQSQAEQRVQLRGTVVGDNGVQIRVSDSYRSTEPLMLPGMQVRTLNGNDIAFFFDYTRLNFVGMTQEQFIRQDGLPEGTYRLCIRAFDYDTNQALSPEEPLGCSNPFTISSLEPPTIIRPFDGEAVSSLAGQMLVMSWSTAIGSPPSTRYRIRMVEIEGERNPNDAMFSATQPYFFDREVVGNMYVYQPADPQLTPGRRYALMVEAFDPANSVNFRNEGRSEVVSFVFGRPEELANGPPADAEPPVVPPDDEEEAPEVPPLPPMPVDVDPMADRAMNCDCTFPPASMEVLADLSGVRPGTELQVGRFTMMLTQVSLMEGNRLGGTGTIALPFASGIPIRVQFSGIRINPQLQLIEGQVHSVLDERFAEAVLPHQAQATAAVLNPASLAAIEQMEADPQRLFRSLNPGAGDGYALPLGIDRTVGGTTSVLWVARMVFSRDQAAFDAGLRLDLPDATPSSAVFGASTVCVEPDRLCHAGMLTLAQDLPLNIAGSRLMLKSGAGESATRVAFDGQGFSRLHVRAEYAFPEAQFEGAEGGPVTAVMTADADSWSDWVATVQVAPFRIAGLPDFTFRTAQMFYDHSDRVNPDGIKAEYVQGLGGLWRGFYAANVDIDLPAAVKRLGQNEPVRARGSSFVIDADGLTGSVSATDVFSLEQGDLAGWAYSLSRLSLDFRRNGFVGGSMEGQILLPFADAADPSSRLNYTSTLSSGSDGLGFQFVVRQAEALKVPMWKATFALENSAIEVTVGQGQATRAKARMNGSLSMSERLPVVGQVSFDLIRFENLTFSSQAPYFERGSATFFGQASPQKFLGGFPVSMPLNPRMIGSGGSVGIQFPIELSLADIASIPKAEVTLGVLGKPVTTGGRLRFEFDKVEIDKIAVDGMLGAFHVNGEIEFFSDDPKWGDGLEGDLQTTFFGTFSVKARALFGKRERSYWFLDARLNLDTGIPVGPGISVFGFGGGAYYNLRMNTDPQRAVSFNYGNSKPRDLYEYSPDIIGFKAGINLGSSDGRILLVMGDLEATFSTQTAALRQIGIKANGAMFAPSLSQIEQAVVKAGADIVFDVQHSVFSARAAVEVNVASIMQAQADMSILSAPDGWHFKLGDPVRPVDQWPGMKIQITPFIKLAEAYFYFNVGTKDMNLPPRISEVWSRVMGGASQANNFAARGLFFGADHRLIDVNLRYLIFYMKLQAWYNFDIALVDLTDVPINCDGRETIGFSNFYAMGSAQAGVLFDFGLFVDVWFFEGEVSVGKVEANTKLNVALPNPTWINGLLEANYSVLGGIVKGRMRFRVDIGTKCSVGVNPFAGLPIISDIEPGNGATDVSILSDVAIALNFYVDREFQIEEPRDDGGFNVHTFKAVITSARLNGEGVDYHYTNDAYGDRDGNASLSLSYDQMQAVLYGWREALAPKTRYTATVTAQGYELKGGRWESIASSAQTMSVSFETGECINSLNDGSGNNQAVVGSYPFPGQRYFTAQHVGRGYLNLQKSIPCLIPTPSQASSPGTVAQLLQQMQQNTVMVAVFQSESDRVESAATASGDRINFNIPSQLQPNTVYRLQLVKRLSAGFVAQLNSNAAALANLSAAQPLMSQPVAGPEVVSSPTVTTSMTLGNAMQYSTRYLDANNSVSVAAKQAVARLRNRDEVVYTMYFRTSRFATLQAKVDAITTSGTGTVKFLDFVEFNLSSAEPFDIYDIRGWSYTNTLTGQTLVIPPLIEFREDITQNPWFQEHMIPVADNFSILSRYARYDPGVDAVSLLDRASHWNPRRGSNNMFGRQRERAFDVPVDVRQPLSTSETNALEQKLNQARRFVDRFEGAIQIDVPVNRFQKVNINP